MAVVAANWMLEGSEEGSMLAAPRYCYDCRIFYGGDEPCRDCGNLNTVEVLVESRADNGKSDADSDWD